MKYLEVGKFSEFSKTSTECWSAVFGGDLNISSPGIPQYNDSIKRTSVEYIVSKKGMSQVFGKVLQCILESKYPQKRSIYQFKIVRSFHAICSPVVKIEKKKKPKKTIRRRKTSVKT